MFPPNQVLGQPERKVVEGKSLSQAPEDVSAELVAQNNNRKFSISVSHPVTQRALADFHQILLKKKRDLRVDVGPPSKPALHHLRRHVGVSVPLAVLILSLFAQGWILKIRRYSLKGSFCLFLLVVFRGEVLAAVLNGGAFVLLFLPV